MSNLKKTLLKIIIAGLCLFPLISFAQVQNQYWKVLSNILQPTLNAYGLKIPSFGGFGARCLHTDNDGLVTIATADCGAGGSSFAFPFTPVSYGNATTTTLGFLNGFLSTASSTINSTFLLPSLGQGVLYTGTGGVVGVTSSSSFPTYTNASPTLSTLGGIAAGTTFSAQTMTQMWDALLYPYTAPTITLSANISTAVREFGNSIASINFTGTTVKKTNPITTVSFLRNGTPINYVSGPNPNGATETYTENTAVTTATSFTAKVSDNTATSTSNTLTYSFVYPYYDGVGAQSLTGAQIRSLLTTVVQASTASTAFTSSPVAQVYYECQLSSYAHITSVLDQNGFETIAGYTVRDPVAIVGLDSTSQNYRCLELAIPTTATNFTNTFKQ